MDSSCQYESPGAAAAAIQKVLANVPTSELQATSKQLIRILKAMQQQIQQEKTTANSDSRLVTCLQSLFSYGWGSESLKNRPSLEGTAAPLPPPQAGNSSSSSASSPVKRYIPPGARKSMQQSALSAGISSDSEASDAEGWGCGSSSAVKAARVRHLALACLQCLIKNDAKALHPPWPSLLPEAGVDLKSTPEIPESSINLGQSLVLDASTRVRHSAAVTLATLLEGPAQRAYLAVAELRSGAAAPPVRGFVPLSTTLAQLVVGTHQALLLSLEQELDVTVVTASLRALGTVILGTPYARLPAELLVNCVKTLQKVLQRAQRAQQDDSTLSSSWTPVICGSLSCLAAALATKPPSSSLLDYLSSNKSSAHDVVQPIETPSLAEQLLEVARARENPSVLLEAIMALRGLTQQYFTIVSDNWNPLFISVKENIESAAVTTDHASLSSTAASGDSLPSPRESAAASWEKVAQQSILLAGDYVKQCKNEEKWALLIDCIRTAFAGTSPVLRAAAFGAIAGASADSITAMARENREFLLNVSCESVVNDAASPVRAAAARALASLLTAAGPTGELQAIEAAIPALKASCSDPVAAVRVHAAAALAAAADSLYTIAAKTPRNDATLAIVEDLMPSAVQAATDSDKIKPNGVQALGWLLAARCTAGNLVSPAEAEVEALTRCLYSDVLKVQWSACSAGANLLGAAYCGKNKEGRGEAPFQQIVAALQELIVTSSNSRTRAIAVEALEKAGFVEKNDENGEVET